ncbi:MAG: hypothetical protein IPL61_39305 [Myxococcales bacterium]|nr:hypothetical protein [Myxococcales bacterium]
MLTAEIDRLRGLLDEDLEGFVARVVASPWFRDVLRGVLPQLQARPDAVAALRARLPDYRQRELTTWLRRTLLPLPTPRGVADFCALATARARRLDPAFPLLDPTALVVTYRGYCAVREELDRRIDGRGWTAAIEDRDVGPAEVIHEVEWRATAHAPTWSLTVELAEVSSMPWAWEELVAVTPAGA